MTAAEKAPVFDVITVSAAITPPIAEYVVQSIGEAAKSGAEGLIIRLDTPGGLDLAMRDIAKGILNAPIPVIVYVAPSGARAASAGVIITISAHIAAMAPGTNIGAAHPVGMGIGGGMDKTMSTKVENDAVAYVRGIAKQRGRNEEWVEKAVRKSESITAEQALRLKVIDFVAADMNQLLAQADGREVSLVGGKKILRTKGAILNEKKMGTRQKILSALSDPNIAYILLLIGLAGLYFEFSTPGVDPPRGDRRDLPDPGLLRDADAPRELRRGRPDHLQHHPVHRGDQGGQPRDPHRRRDRLARHRFPDAFPDARSRPPDLLERLDPRGDAHRRSSSSPSSPSPSRPSCGKPLGGKEGLAGEEGTAVTDVLEEGKVLIHGEYWNAVSNVPVAKDAKVRVIGVENLKVRVEPIE